MATEESKKDGRILAGDDLKVIRDSDDGTLEGTLVT